MIAPVADLTRLHPALPARVHDLGRLPLEHALAALEREVRELRALVTRQHVNA